MTSPIRTRLTRAAGALALAVAAAGALVGATAGPAAATTTDSVIRIAPESNFLLTLDVRGGSTSAGGTVDQWTVNGGSNQMWVLRQRPDGYYWIVNVQSNLCLATDGVAGHPVFQWFCSDTDPGVLWNTNLTTGNLIAYSIQNKGSGLYLDVHGDSRTAGADIDTWYWNGGSNQFFLGTKVA
jgi:Ricin-type beta-trefoil lectin domain-like